MHAQAFKTATYRLLGAAGNDGHTQALFVGILHRVTVLDVGSTGEFAVGKQVDDGIGEYPIVIEADGLDAAQEFFIVLGHGSGFESGQRVVGRVRQVRVGLAAHAGGCQVQGDRRVGRGRFGRPTAVGTLLFLWSHA